MKRRIHKILCLLLCSLLISTPTFPFFDLSPWIVIDNTTQFEFTCQIEALYYPSEDENRTIFINKDDNFNVSFDQCEDEDGNECIKIMIIFMCSAHHAIVLEPMFYEDDSLFNPEIKSLSLTHESLQIQTICYPTQQNNRYFSINYQPDNGFTVTNNEISTWITCVNNFKKAIRTIILAALNAVNWLPY